MIFTLLVAIVFAYLAERRRQTALVYAVTSRAWAQQAVEIDGTLFRAPEFTFANDTAYVYPALHPSRIDLRYGNTIVEGVFELSDSELVIVTSKTGQRPACFDDAFDGKTVLRFSRNIQ